MIAGCLMVSFSFPEFPESVLFGNPGMKRQGRGFPKSPLPVYKGGKFGKREAGLWEPQPALVKTDTGAAGYQAVDCLLRSFSLPFNVAGQPGGDGV